MFGAADKIFARELYDKKCPIEVIEQAVLLGCARRIISDLNRGSTSLILTFVYFKDLIPEIERTEVLFKKIQFWREGAGGPGKLHYSCKGSFS